MKVHHSCVATVAAALFSVAFAELVDVEVKTMSVEPRLHLVENFATDVEVDFIIKQAFQSMRPQNQNAETGIVHELPIGRSPILENVYDRMSSVFPGIGLPTFDKSSETFRVRRYLPDGKGIKGGDYHPPHTDWFDASDKGDNSNVLIISMLIYLTGPEKGGTTYFPHAWHNGSKGFHFQPKRGSLAAWWSCYQNGTQDFTSEHSSEPLLEGIKWNAARFFYDNTKKCGNPAAKTIKVPKEALEIGKSAPDHSDQTEFGTTFPQGVWATQKGTSTEGQVHGGGYGTEEEDEEGLDQYLDDADAQAMSDFSDFEQSQSDKDIEKEMLRKQAEIEMMTENMPEAQRNMMTGLEQQEASEEAAKSNLKAEL